MPSVERKQPVDKDTTHHAIANIKSWDYDRGGEAYAIQCTCGWWTSQEWTWQGVNESHAKHAREWEVAYERARLIINRILEVPDLTASEREAMVATLLKDWAW